MIGFLLELINIYLLYSVSFAIKLFPMWKTRDVKARNVCVFVACYTLLICAGLLAVKQFFTLDLRIMQLYKVFISLPGYFLGFWAFRKRGWQNIFLLAISAMYITIPVGIGTYGQVNWFADNAYPLLGANFVRAAVLALTLPPLLLSLRRLCENPNMEQRVWRIIWILPMAFFGVVLLFGGAFNENRYKSEDSSLPVAERKRRNCPRGRGAFIGQVGLRALRGLRGIRNRRQRLEILRARAYRARIALPAYG